MSKLIVFLTLLVSFSYCVNLEGYEIFQINSNSDGQLFQLEQNKRFAFQLSSNPSTGYEWVISNIDEIKKSNLLSIVNLTEKNGGEFLSDPNPSHYTGVGGKCFFKIHNNNNGAGIVNINLSYKRSWEDKPMRSFVVKVEVI